MNCLKGLLKTILRTKYTGQVVSGHWMLDLCRVARSLVFDVIQGRTEVGQELSIPDWVLV